MVKKKKKERENRRQYWIFRGYNTHEVFRAETILCYIVMGYVHSVASFVSDSFVTTWTIAHQAPLSMGFPRQQSGLPFPSPGELPDQASNQRLLRWSADSLLLSHQGSPRGYCTYREYLNIRQ